MIVDEEHDAGETRRTTTTRLESFQKLLNLIRSDRVQILWFISALDLLLRRHWGGGQ